MDSVGRSVVTTLTTSTILVFSLKRVGWWRRRTTWQGKGEGGGWRIGQDVWSERRRPVGQGTPAKCTVPLSSCTESCLDICLDQLLDRDGERERERERGRHGLAWNQYIHNIWSRSVWPLDIPVVLAHRTPDVLIYTSISIKARKKSAVIR